MPGAIQEVEESKKYWLKKREEAKISGVLPTAEPSSSVQNGVAKPPPSNKKQAFTEFKLEEWPGRSWFDQVKQASWLEAACKVTPGISESVRLKFCLPRVLKGKQSSRIVVHRVLECPSQWWTLIFASNDVNLSGNHLEHG